LIGHRTSFDDAAMYELRRPAAGLSRFIEHYWFVTSTPQEPVDLRVDVFVDARADLIFNFGASYVRQMIGGRARKISRSNLDAQRLHPIRIAQQGIVRTTGVRFRLGGVGPFARAPLHDFTNAIVPPHAALGAEARALESALRDTADLDEQARYLDAFFQERLSLEESFEGFETALLASVETNGAASVDDMAAAARVSNRQVERLFRRYLGIAPKVLARILRFQSALKALMRDPGCSLAEVAVAAGYFDQAHFIKDFRRMSGGVPRGYRGYYPPQGPADFAPNVVVFLQDAEARAALGRAAWRSTGPARARKTIRGSSRRRR
jgi:AraC-like DNA-binding protein